MAKWVSSQSKPEKMRDIKLTGQWPFLLTSLPPQVVLRDFTTSSPGLRSQIQKVEDVSQ